MDNSINVVADIYVTISGQDYGGYSSDPYDHEDVNYSGIVRLESTLTNKEIRKQKSVEEYFCAVIKTGIKNFTIGIDFKYPRRIEDIEAEVRFLWERLPDETLTPLYEAEAQKCRQNWKRFPPFTSLILVPVLILLIAPGSMT